MYQPSTQHFHPHIISYIIQQIEQNQGDEVFFVAWVDREGIITECEAVAFGNQEAVPAPLSEGLKGDLVIHNHPSGDLRASNPDINIASLLATKKLGFYIINNDCSSVNIIYKPKNRVFLKETQTLSIFQQNGLLEEFIGFYEKRSEQEQLVHKITSTINNNHVLLAEAGTGTGKSLSYLIPSALWAVQSNKTVFISTHTINLQNQIIQKDAEIVSSIVERITGNKVKFAVLVGKSNYLCIKALDELLHDSQKNNLLFDDIKSINNQLELITVWAEKTYDGLRSSIPEKISSDLWEELSAATPNCPRRECPFYSDCFYFKARMTAEASHILIGNHSLLLAAIDDEQGFLSTIPHFSGIVLDEAHTLPMIAIGAMAENFSFASIIWRINRLYRVKGDREFGHLSLLKDKAALDRNPSAINLHNQITSGLLSLTQNIKKRENFLRDILQDNVELSTEITTSLLLKEPWVTVKQTLAGLFDEIRRIESLIGQLLEIFQDQDQESLLGILRVIDIHSNALGSMRQTFEKIFNNLDSDTIAVKQMEFTNTIISFSAGPATIEDYLTKHIFRPKEFTILSSATLSVNNNFDFFTQGVGLNYLDQEYLDSIILPSPFDYKQQMETIVINEQYLTPGKQEQEKLEILRQAILTVGGGALLLFTSYKAMENAYQTIADDLAQNGLLPIKQGEYSREYLINTMRSKDYTVLFGTSSFWEGVDVQGDNLRFLAIDKLPFDNPYNPLIKAISRLYEEKGKNPFTEFSIPRAVLKYKQGIGRLIRSKKDRGILLVLDNRIFSKAYGKHFIQAAKPSQSLSLSPQDIISRIKKFFKIIN